ncbi:hypothetical protein Sjap_012318 [Stephania japonica]|uniref:Uncharacterized protein n=1 Tax=Stephania japonica TaxID=461633 RepID=A0AAP0IY80_9MAGN
MMSREQTHECNACKFRSKGKLRKKKTGELLAPLVSPKKRKRGDSESSASSKYGRRHERIISKEPKQVHNVDSCKVERQNNDVVVNVEAMIKSMPSSNCCIFRVPKDLRRKEEKFMYKPKILSIGPFYHGKGRLQLMENHKQWYLRAFLDRSKPLNELVEAIGNLESEARKCYADPMDSLTRNQFVQMMFVKEYCAIRKYVQITPVIMLCTNHSLDYVLPYLDVSFCM